MMSEVNVLQSWKEIAGYLNRGVRTVQRWEMKFGLPVHRPAGHARSAVLALKAELDEWLARTDMRTLEASGTLSRGELLAELERLQAECDRLRAALDAASTPVGRPQRTGQLAS